MSYAWSLGYLMSYEGMGRARGSCVGGGACTCGARVEDAREAARVFDACGLPPPAGSSLFAGLADWLHHSQHTVVVDQALILFPALLLGGWQLSESNAALQRLIVAAAGLYCVVACLRLRHLGYIQ